MVEPLFTVRDFRTELSDEVTDPDDDELLRNYEFNISQGIVQRVSRFFDALALSDEPPAHNAGGQSADVAPPPFVMNFGNKRSIGRQETVVLERSSQKEGEQAAAAAARKAAEQDTKLAALEAQIAEMQALAVPSAPYLCSAPYAPPPSLPACITCTTCRQRSSGRRSLKS